MKVFLVWSGRRSFAIAQALNEFLPRVIQAIKPFFSHEIEKGAKWSSEIDEALEGTHFGIVCLTPDNLSSTWIHFETGALSKTRNALIWTYLSDLKNSDVPQPLGKFQHTTAEKADTLKLIKNINTRLSDVGGEPLPEQILLDNFEVWWPKLNDQLTAARSSIKRSDVPQRDHGVMLEEILELLRDQKRNQAPPAVYTTNFDSLITAPLVIKFKVPKNIVKARNYAEKYRTFFSEACLIPSSLTQSKTDYLLMVTLDDRTPLEEIDKLFEKAYEQIGWKPDSWVVRGKNPGGVKLE